MMGRTRPPPKKISLETTGSCPSASPNPAFWAEARWIDPPSCAPLDHDLGTRRPQSSTFAGAESKTDVLLAGGRICTLPENFSGICIDHDRLERRLKQTSAQRNAPDYAFRRVRHVSLQNHEAALIIGVFF